MEYLNHELFSGNPSLIDIICNSKISTDKFNQDDEFYAINNLYDCILRNCRNSFYSLFNYNIEYDLFGFQSLQIILRQSVEALFDLLNLIADPFYYQVLVFSSSTGKKRKELQNEIIKYYNMFFTKGSLYFTINDKKNIIKHKIPICEDVSKVEKMFETFVILANYTNDYAHPNVFIDSELQPLSTILTVQFECVVCAHEALHRYERKQIFIYEHPYYLFACTKIQNIINSKCLFDKINILESKGAYDIH